MTFRASKIALLVALALVTTTVAWAIEPVNAKGRDRVAIHGYDPVSYFSGVPERGSTSWVHPWMNSVWHFASAANRDLFAAEPERYAPQYGGYCAYAVSKGSIADVDPEAWTVVGDKLYLNYSISIRTKWRKDIPGNVAKADRNWPKLLAD